MSSLRFAVSASPCLTVVLSALHVGAGGLVAILPVSTLGKAMFILAVLWSLRHCIRQAALLRAPGAIVAVNVTREGQLFCQTRRSEWLDCELLPSTFVSRRLTILNLQSRATRQMRHVILCPDNVGVADFRRLRVWLRWAAQNSVIRE